MITEEEYGYRLVIDGNDLERYDEYYFTLHPKAKNRPIPHPYHESINTWMVMKRPMMNALKQRWKDFISWMVSESGCQGRKIAECEVRQKIYYPSGRRHDVDNTVPKFILDGLVEGGLIEDDDSRHIKKLTLECGVDRSSPRTEIEIMIEKNSEAQNGDNK